MSSDYETGEGGANVGASGRPVTRQPYRGPRLRNRQTGEVVYWVGDRYVSQNSLERLTPQERTARQEAIDNANRLATMLPDLSRFERLNRTVPTGSLTHRFGLWAGNMPRVLGIDNPATQGNEPQMMDEMRAITDRLTPWQRVPGSGASSNLDVDMFRSALPNIGRTGPANSQIVGGYRRSARDAGEYAQFLDWYWPRTGSLSGAQEQFTNYRRARERNPRLTWRQYFRADDAPAAPAANRGGRGGDARGNARGGGTDGGGAVERWERDPRTGEFVRAR